MLVIDEACAADGDILNLALGQLSGSPADVPLTRIQSTPTKLVHPFRAWWDDAPAEARFTWTGYPEDCPWVSPTQMEQDRALHDKNWLRIHHEGEFGSATGTVFDPDDVDACSLPRPPDGHRSFGCRCGPACPVKDDLPWVTGARLGVDWGFQHPTVLTVLVAVEPPPAADELPMPPTYTVAHAEGWVGRGEAWLYARILDLVREWRADAFLDASHVFQNEALRAPIRDAGRRSFAVPFSKAKMEMVGNLNRLLQTRRLRIPFEARETKAQLLSYSWEEGREVPAKVADDWVDSLMLAAWGFRVGGRPGLITVDPGIFG
jgi:hypothetical protein